MSEYLRLSAMIGETLTDIQGMEVGSESVTFTTESGRAFRMWHEQDCCESVSLNEIIGTPSDLIGVKLLMSEASSDSGDNEDGSYTWTFYRFGTVKGYVNLRWLGESNGYYSEGVEFTEVPNV